MFYAKDKRMIKDSRVRYFVPPKRIVWLNEGVGSIDSADNLLKDDQQICTVKAAGGCSVVLDFGEEFNGGIEIYIANDHPAAKLKMRLRFGESVSEVINEPNNDHAIHDMVVEMSVMARQEFGNTGFRFVRIDFLDCSVAARIAAINLVALEHNFDYLGSFESSDPLLNDIWQIGARTVHLCCQDYIYDGIKRDRLLWAGDLHPQINVIANVFGDVDIVPRTLDRARDVTPVGEWMNGYSTYSLWWIVCVYDWYFYTGNKKWLSQQKEYLEALVDNVLSFIDSSGNEHFPPNRFIDWVIGYDRQPLDSGLHALTIFALQKAFNIFEILVNDTFLAKLSRVIESMTRVPCGSSKVKQVMALETLAGLIDPQEANKTCLSIEPSKNISTWYAYYVLQSRSMAGDIAGSLAMIREFWGGMLSLGATSFWEHFNTDWLENASRIDEIPIEGKVDVHKDCGEYCFVGLRHSLCHGWSGGPTAWLSQNILGIKPASPGFKTVVIKPQLGNLSYVKGSLPTPYGVISVECSAENGKQEVGYDLPQGVEVIEESAIC